MNEKERELVSRELTPTTINSLGNINLLDPGQVTAAEVIIKRLMASDKSGIKSIQDGLAVIMKAQDLQLPFSTCLEHVHVINGKTGVDVHVIKALLSRAGVTWNCLKDYTPLYEYTDGFNVYYEHLLPNYTVVCINQEKANKLTEETNGDKVGVYPVKFYKGYSDGAVYKEYQLNPKMVVAVNQQQAAVLIKENKYPIYRIASVPINYITEYEFTRRKLVNGKEVITTCKSSFSHEEALVANLFAKDTYVKYAKTLIGHRAFTYGARDIASDILFGVLETTELKIINGRELDDREIIDIQVEPINE